jgi:hypothetical protein
MNLTVFLTVLLTLATGLEAALFKCPNNNIGYCAKGKDPKNGYRSGKQDGKKENYQKKQETDMI